MVQYAGQLAPTTTGSTTANEWPKEESNEHKGSNRYYSRNSHQLRSTSPLKSKKKEEREL
jgi:hypothetical protein